MCLGFWTMAYILVIQALLGIACYDSRTKIGLMAEAAKRTLDLKIVDKPNWYI